MMQAITHNDDVLERLALHASGQGVWRFRRVMTDR